MLQTVQSVTYVQEPDFIAAVNVKKLSCLAGSM